MRKNKTKGAGKTVVDMATSYGKPKQPTVIKKTGNVSRKVTLVPSSMDEAFKKGGSVKKMPKAQMGMTVGDPLDGGCKGGKCKVKSPKMTADKPKGSFFGGIGGGKGSFSKPKHKGLFG